MSYYIQVGLHHSMLYLLDFMDLKNRNVVEVQNLCDGMDRISPGFNCRAHISKRDLGPMHAIIMASLKEANSGHVAISRKKKLLIMQQAGTSRWTKKSVFLMYVDALSTKCVHFQHHQ